MLSEKSYNLRDIKKKLQELGLSISQSSVYLATLKLKKASVLDIAKTTNIQRPTIYDAVRILEQSGLVGYVVEGSKKYIVPNKPDNLTTLIQKKQKLACSLIPDLEDIYEDSRSLPPKIRFFQGEEGLKKLTEVILTSKEKKIRTLADYEENIQKPFSEQFLRRLWKARTQKNIFGHILYTNKSLSLLKKSPDYNEIGNIKYNREVRILPKELDMNILYTIVDNNVLFWSSKEENYSFHFSSPSYANSLKSIFDFLWNQSEKFPKS